MLAPVSYGIKAQHVCRHVRGQDGNYAKSVASARIEQLIFMARLHDSRSAPRGLAVCRPTATRFTSRRDRGNRRERTKRHEDQRAILRLAHRSHDIRPGRHGRDISKIQCVRSVRNTGIQRVTNASHDLCACRCRTHPNRQAVAAGNR